MGSITEQERLVQREAQTPLDRWIGHALKDCYGHVAREPIPEQWLELLGASPSEH